MEIVGINLFPTPGDSICYLTLQFPVIQSNVTFAIQLGLHSRAKMFREKSFHLSDRCLIDALCIHNIVEDTDIKWHHRNCCRCLRNHRFVDRNIGIAAEVVHKALVKRGIAAVETNAPGDDAADRWATTWLERAGILEFERGLRRQTADRTAWGMVLRGEL